MPNGRNVASMKRNYPGAVTKSVLNAGPSGRSAIEAPQGDGVDGKAKPQGRTELSSKSRCDEGYRRPSETKAAASDTHSDEYGRGNPTESWFVWISV